MRLLHLVLALAFEGCCFTPPPPAAPPVPVPPLPIAVPPVPMPIPPIPPSVPPVLPTPSMPGAAPDGWPEGFPVIAGGTAMPVPPAGPVRVAVLAYSGTTVDALDASYHTELAAAGWTATASDSGPEAHRFTATRGPTTVSVSVYGEGAQVVIQTMQMLF